MSFSAFLPNFANDSTELPPGLTGFHSERTEPLVAAMAPDASIMLLMGEPGAGKSFLAQQVADELMRTHAETVHSFQFPYPREPASDVEQVFGDVFERLFAAERADPLGWLGDTFHAAVIAEELTREAQQLSEKPDPLFILPAIDRYAPRATAVLEHLIRQRVVRIIATAARVEGGASSMLRDPRVTHMSVSPLDLEESGMLLSAMLGNAQLSEPTLRRWHDLSDGNRRALMLMFVANERAGSLRRHHGIAHVRADREYVPEEILRETDERCSETERQVLRLLAIAEPVTEPAVLRLLDAGAVNSLLARRVISMTHHTYGETALHISRPMLSAALRAHMSPVQRLALTEQLYHALIMPVHGAPVDQQSPHLVRIVKYGLDLERQLPHDWLVAAVAHLAVDGDPVVMLRVSLALAVGYTTTDSVAAVIRAASYATRLRDVAAAGVAHQRIDEMVAQMNAQPDAFQAIPNRLRTRLQLMQIERRFRLGTAMRTVHELLDRIAEKCDDDDTISLEAVASLRLQLCIQNGEAAQVDVDDFTGRASDDVAVEWVRATAQSFTALRLQQQGALQQAITVASRARNIDLLGRRPLNDITELLSLIWFLAHWSSGSSESARKALEEIAADERGSRHTGIWLSGLSDIGWAMLAMQEARWRDAAGLTEMVLEDLTTDDPFGAAPLLYAVKAQALAALGLREPALIALQRAREDRRGLSQALRGFRLCIVLHAQMWLRVGDVPHEARSLAAWAREHELGFVELQALYVAALSSSEQAREVLGRAIELARGVDPLIAEVVVSHMQKIAGGSEPSDVSAPEVRLLADLGLWIPLPAATQLTAREREIALLASLGYTSRFIAERFHLSERTVETHLAHVYSKLGVSDRGDLRAWFSADRRAR